MRLTLALVIAAALAITAVSVTAERARDAGRHEADRSGQGRDQDEEQGEEGKDDGGPAAPAYDQGHHQLYAATDLGVFYDKNSARNWKRLGHELPASPVLDIKITGDGTTMYAATFGRSVWRMPLPSS